MNPNPLNVTTSCNNPTLWHFHIALQITTHTHTHTQTLQAVCSQAHSQNLKLRLILLYLYQVLHYDTHFQGKIWWNSTRHEKQLKRKTIKTSKGFKLSTVSMERASIPTPAISVKSHLIEWVGSSWSNPSVKCVLPEIKSDMLNLICGCTIIGLCLSIWLTVNYDMLVAWVPRCNEVWMCEAGTSFVV